MRKNYEVVLALVLTLILGFGLISLSGTVTRLYDRIDQCKKNEDNLRLSTAYYMTKIKNYDILGSLKIKSEDQNPTLVVKESEGVYTHIFLDNGVLYEITVGEGVEVTSDFAFKIAEIDSVEFDYTPPYLSVKLFKLDRESEILLRLNSKVDLQ